MEIIKIVRRERNLLEILMIIWEDSVRLRYISAKDG